MKIARLARRVETTYKQLRQAEQQASSGAGVFIYQIIDGCRVLSPGDQAQLEERQRRGLASILLPENHRNP